MPLQPLDTTKPLDHASHEEEVLRYWDETDAFKRSVTMRPKDKPYTFYDGPPFATGLPHYGHLLASTAKDVVPRYWTMRGYRVERTWGWDCHGVPIENMIEGELGLKGGKFGIEAYGVAKFNQACRTAILRFDKEWRQIIARLGRWVDMDNSYKTMDRTFMESVWWAFGKLYQQNLVKEGKKVILYCPRCATPLSNFEIAMDNSYREVETHSLYVKFHRTGTTEYFVAWTTTPWTLPGNVALAVHPEADYSLVEVEGDQLWFASQLAPPGAKVLQTAKGQELVGSTYEPLYPYLPPTEGKQSGLVVPAEFVSLNEGTGIVHTAAVYGEDDYQLALREHLNTVSMLDDTGHFLDFITPLAGQYYTKAGAWIIEDLTGKGLVYQSAKIMHSAPFCYRCGTALYYNAVPAWFIDIQRLKPKLKEHNEAINWYPAHLKYGRFGKGLATAPDWNISRSRYWGTPMPIWVSPSGKRRVISSVEELKHWAVTDPGDLPDIHREFLDDLEVYVDDERRERGRRIPEVFDCWVESGSMPFASIHYPFVAKPDFGRPADFIVEYIAQTRAWFYTLHVMSVALFDKPSFVNAVTTGTILAEDGTKMSKSKKNYPDPTLVMHKYGVDSLRLYLMSSIVMRGENLNFQEGAVDEIRKSVMNIWWNSYVFYNSVRGSSTVLPSTITHVLDRWLLSRLASLINHTTEAMDRYDIPAATRLLMDFVRDLSNWYIRLSRKRLREDASARAVLGHTLKTYSLLMAPFAPFMSERIYQALGGEDSVHLADWPSPVQADEKLETDMQDVMTLVEKGSSERKMANIRLRQPLAKGTISKQLAPELEQLLREQLNLKSLAVTQADIVSVTLDTALTPDLIAEGEANDIMRSVQGARKKLGLKPSDKVRVELPAWPNDWEAEIMHKVGATKLEVGPTLQVYVES